MLHRRHQNTVVHTLLMQTSRILPGPGLGPLAARPFRPSMHAFKQNSCMHQQHTLCARSHSIRTSRLPVSCSGSGAPPHSGASARPQPHRPGDVLAGSEGQPSRQSSTPSPSRSAHRAQHGSMLSTWLPYSDTDMMATDTPAAVAIMSVSL